jgi:hypothetical protein
LGFALKSIALRNFIHAVGSLHVEQICFKSIEYNSLCAGDPVAARQPMTNEKGE